MSMSHKAYLFDWHSFENDELYSLILTSLETSSTSGLLAYIERYRQRIKNPHEGEPLPTQWHDLLQNRDVQEYADFALTRFYEPNKEHGIHEEWMSIDAILSKSCRFALLGFSIGPEHHLFDPGRQGSYFQTPDLVSDSLKVLTTDLTGLDDSQLELLDGLMELMRDAMKVNNGLYITF